MSAPGGADEWETQTTRKQRKKQAKEQEALAEVAAPAAAAAAAAASSSASAAASEPVAASDSSFPVSAESEASMESDFLEAGFIGLDGQQIPKGAPIYMPPQQSPAQFAAAAAARKPRYAFDAAQLPKCFVCQTRHDIDQCRKGKKDRF